MAQPQSGVLPEANGHAIFLTFTLNPAEEDAARMRRGAAAFPGLTDQVAGLDPDSALVSSLGVGAAAWDRLFPEARPRHLRPFHALSGLGGSAPATAGDLLVHIRGERRDLNFELSRRLMRQIGAAVSLIEEVQGFRYLDSRDLTGFVDGTENPSGDDRAAVALVGEEDPDFAGGSYVAAQRYVHDLGAWEALSAPQQEAIIARTKEDDIEFEADAKPLTAHIKRVSVERDGKSLEILRHSMPYGSVSEQGLLFIAYGASPDNFDLMLRSMIEGDGEDHFDCLMKYTRAVTGASFFVPARDWLER